MAKGDRTETEDIRTTLVKAAKPKMSPKDLMKAVRRAHPNASRKDIMHAAFSSVIAIVDKEPAKAAALHEFALKERSGGEGA